MFSFHIELILILNTVQLQNNPKEQAQCFVSTGQYHCRSLVTNITKLLFAQLNCNFNTWNSKLEFCWFWFFLLFESLDLSSVTRYFLAKRLKYQWFWKKFQVKLCPVCRAFGKNYKQLLLVTTWYFLEMHTSHRNGFQEPCSSPEIPGLM